MFTILFQVQNICKDSAMLYWKVPLNNGESSIFNYIVEKRETDRVTWSTISPTCQKTLLKVALNEGKSYLFRFVLKFNSLS